MKQRLAENYLSSNTSTLQDVCRHCMLCAPYGNMACQLSHSVLFFRLSSSTNYHMPPRRSRVTQALLIVADWRPSSVSLLHSDTETCRLLHLLISVRKRMIHCSTTYCIMINICSAHSSHQKRTNIILSVTAITTCSCRFAPLTTITITLTRMLFKDLSYSSQSSSTM